MAAPRPLSDDEVHQEMKKMVAFIKQEAVEKAREIQVKADEEFNIEKAKLVRQETVNIEAAFTRKVKQAEVQRKIAQSTHINKARLRVLQAREQLLGELFTEARQKLLSVSKDTAVYQKLLNDLILQTFYKLMDNMTIQCRKSDVPLVETAITEAAKSFNSLFKELSVSATIDSNNYLPEDGAGGIIASSLQGRIRCNNTLEVRLELLADQMLPDIRTMLFGVSESRKFYN